MSQCPRHGRTCYAVWINSAGHPPVFRVDEFCTNCDAHLAANGVCLNACHLTPRQKERIAVGLKLAAAAVEEAKRQVKGKHDD